MLLISDTGWTALKKGIYMTNDWSAEIHKRFPVSCGLWNKKFKAF